jgi:hypothetical protein
MIARLATGEIDDAEQKSSLPEIETLPQFRPQAYQIRGLFEYGLRN